MTSNRREPWASLLEIALHAPSPHNVQPWRVRILGDAEAELWIEKCRTLPKEDVTGSFIVLTMGMFVETLRIAASHRRLAIEDEHVHPPSWYTAAHLESMPDARFPFARLRLREAPDTRPTLPLALIRERRTSRLAYLPEPVDAAATARLEEVARAWGHRYVSITDAATIERLLRWNVNAVFEDLNHAPYHDELSGWIRYSRSQSDHHRDGLDARCMNLSPIELWLTFRSSWLLQFAPARPWLRRRYRAQIGSVATLGLLGGRFWDPADAYETGRFLVHFWLEVTRVGYFIHPYGNLVTNHPAAARLASETGVNDAWLVFKIGRSAPPPESRRRSLEEVLL